MPDNGARPAVSFDALAESCPAPIVLIQERTVLYANPAFADLCGVPRGELVGRPFAGLIHAHDRVHVLDQLDEHQRGRGDTYRAQFRMLRPSGEECWVYGTLAVGQAGGRVATVGTVIDVRERRHAQEAVAKSQRLDAVARLAGGIAHGFNNTLQIILGHAERVAAAVPAGHPAAHSAGEIRQSAARAAELTDHLLSLGQRQVLDPQSFDIAKLVTELKGAIERRVGAGIGVVVRRGKWTAPARVDRTRLVHVVAALVDHAREAMPQGGQLTIETSLVTIDGAARTERPWLRDGNYVRLSVEDSGAGVDAEAAAHAFEPFYATRGGTGGLGLASAYGLVKQSRGFVWLEGGESGGTRVVVLLPMEGTVSAVADTPAAPVLRAVPPVRPRPRVLIVEDEGAVRELLTSALDRHGFAAVAVGSAEDAMTATPGGFDILLSDISLPGMNGVELARFVRRTMPAVRVLLMSGYAREEFLTPADDLPFIGKPFTTRAIVERLRTLVDDSTRHPTASLPA